MCGIAGEWRWGGGFPEPSVVTAMIDSLAHRGPEGRTCWFSPDRQLALAHAQLSFFKGAALQPVRNDRQTVFAICNGEIYNYRELAELVRQSGRDIDVRSDVSIIPFIYELRGPASFALLRGEFAFALYDSEKQSLFLVRDRFGIKPLFYHATSNSIAFASEIKALFAHPNIPRSLDHKALSSALIGVLQPSNTAFSMIRQVKPGSYLELSATAVADHSYWVPRLEASGPPKDLDELAREFLPLFDEAVRVRLHGDYPVGVYLSAGIDSSAVLASMVRARPKSLKAFTISFDDKTFDETDIAERTASQLGIEHHCVRVTDRDIADNFLKSVWHSEIPIHNCNGIAKFLLSGMASAHVKAVMTGEGADELFAGYSYFGTNSAAASQRGIRPQLANWYRWLRSRQNASDFLSVPRAEDVDQLKGLFGSAPYLGLRALFYGRFIRWYLNRDFLRCFSPLESLEQVAEGLRRDKVGPMTPMNLDRFFTLRLDLPSYNLSYLADRQEMAHSIEGRVPFLDDDVVAFAARLQDQALVGEGAGKKIVRLAFEKRLPMETIAFRKKQLLAPPTVTNEILGSEWARHLLSKGVVDDVGIFDWRKLNLLMIGLKTVPAHSSVGSALRSLLILIISVHALHCLFVVDRNQQIQFA